MNNNEKTVKSSRSKLVFNIIWWAALILLAVIMINVITAKIKGKVPSVFGYSVVNVITGSMEDEIPTGTYILLKRIDPKDVKKGDIICFYSDDPAIYGLPNTHRVAEEPMETDEGFRFVTRGDANNANDQYCARGEALVGIYVRNMDVLTGFSKLLDGGGLLVFIIVLQLLTFGVIAVRLFMKKEADEPPKNDTGVEVTPEMVEEYLKEKRKEMGEDE